MGKHRISNVEELWLFPVPGAVDSMGRLDWGGSVLGFCSILECADAVLCFCFYLFQPGSVRLLSLQHTCSRWTQDMLSLGWTPSRTPSEGTWVLQMV